MIVLTQDLQGEHAIILGNLAVLESSGPVGEELEFLERYVDGCHHAKEELVLFPALESVGRGGDALIREALDQHEELRELVRELRSGGPPSLAIRLAGLLRSHIEMEDSVTYAVAEYAFSDDEKRDLLESMGRLHAGRCSGFADAAAGISRRFLGKP